VTDRRDRAPDDDIEDIDAEGDMEADDERPIDDADVDAIEDDILDEAEAGAIEADEAAIDDYEAAVREVAGESAPPVVAPIPAERREAKRRPAATTRAPSPSEVAVHVREDVSRFFVIATVAIFSLILLNGLLLGTGGFLRPLATPTPTPTESPSASPSPSASGSPTGSPTTSPSLTASPAASPSPAAS